jgi:hypothetical protein
MIRKFTVIAFSFLVTFFSYAGNTYAYEFASARQTYTAWSSARGSTVNIPETTISDLCGDWDGCTLRMGMYNWDGTSRTASRSSLFYYNRGNKNWRAERSDKAGRNGNNVTEHVMQAWACYFTDGEYVNWYNRGDYDLNFGLLSWNQYNASCKLTIID